MVNIDKDVKLIRCVEKHEILYNKRHSKYKNVRRKEEAWKSVAKECNETRKYLILNKI